MIVSNQREGRWNIKCLAHAHERAGMHEFTETLHMTSPPGNGGPCEKAPTDGPSSAEAIRQISSNGAQKGIDPFELAQHFAPIFLGANVRQVLHDGKFHGRQHLTVQVVQQRYWGQQGDNKPGGALERRSVGRDATHFVSN